MFRKYLHVENMRMSYPGSKNLVMRHVCADMLVVAHSFIYIMNILLISHTEALTVTTRTFDCTATSIDLSVTLREPFFGAAYSFGEFDQPNCRVTGSGLRRITISLPLSSCGTRVIGPGRYEVNVVIQGNEKVIMNGDLSYKLICQYDLQDKTINSDINIEHKSIEAIRNKSPISGPGQSATYEGQGPAPAVFLRILSGAGVDGQLSSKADVGDDMTIDLVLADTSIYSNFVVKNCYAHNRAVQLEMIDSVGCVSNQATKVVRGNVQSQIDGNRLHKFIVFEAFKFPEGDIVHFRCIVTLCLETTGSCPEQCDREKRRRRKRDELGQPGIDYPHDDEEDGAAIYKRNKESQVSGAIVVSAPAIDPQRSDDDGVSQESTDSDMAGLVCVSLVEFAVGVSLVIGVALLCAILTICLCGRLRRRRSKEALLESPQQQQQTSDTGSAGYSNSSGSDRSHQRRGAAAAATRGTFTITNGRDHDTTAAAAASSTHQRSNVRPPGGGAATALEPLHIPRPDY